MSLNIFTKTFTHQNLLLLLISFGLILTDSHLNFLDLEKDLSLNELSNALRTITKGKTPGPDGFSVEFYLHFSDLLLPKLLILFQSFYSSGRADGSFQEAIICLIPKEGRDPQFCKNYRPISLVNVDYKLFAKLLALRLDSLMPHLVGKEQCG